ncbi:hypothetical protein BN874_770047 [Candidatus Contendobacter odensis Run_B_J11]|uniref:Uncharacterized protein n=1 Tax=Candidatus Contendobacter odensis Run_B_J11 TaxID=1400861 RepID=A0A7U7J5T4_9GAMM|nr:hypothetical protein BN874_770047 [Candidatus Contendobacter odensis Run_B_J11]
MAGMNPALRLSTLCMAIIGSWKAGAGRDYPTSIMALAALWPLPSRHYWPKAENSTQMFLTPLFITLKLTLGVPCKQAIQPAAGNGSPTGCFGPLLPEVRHEPTFLSRSIRGHRCGAATR